MQYLDEYVPTTYLQYYMFPDEIVKESDPNYTRADEAKDSREKDVFETCAKAVGRDTMDPFRNAYKQCVWKSDGGSGRVHCL